MVWRLKMASEFVWSSGVLVIGLLWVSLTLLAAKWRIGRPAPGLSRNRPLDKTTHPS